MISNVIPIAGKKVLEFPARAYEYDVRREHGKQLQKREAARALEIAERGSFVWVYAEDNQPA